jgi:glycine/D-amino acid oxidase-like deaminating enzyme
LKLTTLAIIGGGIAGRSLLYALAKEKGLVSKVHLFESPEFFHPCSLRTTATVAPRGVSEGHSPLGNLLMEGFQTFKQHALYDDPEGVIPVTQFTANSEKVAEFKLRYPQGTETNDLLYLKFKKPIYTARENGFIIHPKAYLDFLFKKASENLPFMHTQDLVTEIIPGDQVKIKTQKGESFQFDRIVLAGGVANAHFGQKSQTVQGSYLQFEAPHYGPTPFAITINGDNLVYSPKQYLLIGSTSEIINHELAPIRDLRKVYGRIKSWVELKLPPIDSGEVVIGLREKASKRMPYIREEGKVIYFGGFYKNGFSLSLSESQKVLKLLKT